MMQLDKITHTLAGAAIAAAVSLDGRTWVRASYLPKVKTGASGVTFSVEFTF